MLLTTEGCGFYVRWRKKPKVEGMDRRKWGGRRGERTRLGSVGVGGGDKVCTEQF